MSSEKSGLNMSAARAIRNQIAHSSRSFWEVRDFEGTPLSVAHELSRLAARGELVRVRKGLYWRGGDATPLLAPASELVLKRLYPDGGVGPAEWGAATYLRIGTQIPRRVVWAVPGRAPSGLDKIPLVARTGAWKRLVQRLTTDEVALLELGRAWNLWVDASEDEVDAEIQRRVKTGRIRPVAVRDALLTEPPAVRESIERVLAPFAGAKLVSA
ncbi:MAG: hypothetical protein HKL82_06625 [Acidimicrobiaceae bacterium]|nr:hypothetical protein [Acidimicrobiaceae bacterium]